MIYLFVDTNIFYSKKFNIQSEMFYKIKKWSNNSELKLLTNQILTKEYENNILKIYDNTISSFSDVIKDINTAGSMYKINGQKNNKDIISHFEQYYKTNLINTFWNYIKDLNPIDIGISNNSEKIFEDYFLTNPPFENKEKKKNEFPDAFMIESLISWSNDLNHDDFIYVVSNDNGFVSSLNEAKNFIVFDSINAFVDSINSKLVNQTDAIHFIHDNETFNTFIADKLVNEIDNLDESLISIEDIDDYEIIEIFYRDMSDYEVNIIDINLNENNNIIRCTLSLQVTVTLGIEFSYTNYDKSVYDSETKSYWYLHREDESSYFDSIVEYILFVNLNTDELKKSEDTSIDNIIESSLIYRLSDPISILIDPDYHLY